MQQSWKEAATIILAAFNKSSIKTSWNYVTLTLERSNRSSFMPSGYVFPGGTTEPADSDKKWEELFSSFKLNLKDVEITGTTPPIIKNNTGDLPKLLSLKITAVRETFEETGILLCLNENSKSSDLQSWTSHITFKGLDLWRSKVQKDASEFLNMCKSNNCCPDIRNLHLWSNWLTPTSMGKKRFDTAFFIACLKENPVAVADKTEVEKLSWHTPEALMEACKRKDIWLPPPQVYETARLLNFKDIVMLNDFAFKRSTEGCERWMPVQRKTLDGSVSVLPGDDAYEVSDYSSPTEPAEVKVTTEQFRAHSKALHRLEFRNKTETSVVVQNYSPTHGHVLPVGD